VTTIVHLVRRWCDTTACPPHQNGEAVDDVSQLEQQKRIRTLPCFGYGGVVVKAKRKELLALLRRGLRSHKLSRLFAGK
jgi:hypothetical protein